MEARNRGANLKKAADRNKVEPFTFMKGDGTYGSTPDLEARVSLADRFLSNFHKPLQRRMLFTRPEDPMSPTCVMRHDITNQIFLVGQERYDSDGQSAYERLNVMHLVSNESSTYVDVIKYDKPADADPESMLLVPKVIGKFYISLEYQSSSTERYSDREQSSRMLFYSSAKLLEEANELCEFRYNNKTWSIRQVFYDSGFASGTLIDSGQNIETYNIVKPTNAYDPVAGGWDFLGGARFIPFSASLGEDNSDTSISSKYGSSSDKLLYVKGQFKYSDHFRPGTIIKFPNNKTYRVDRVRDNKRSPDVQLMLSRLVNMVIKPSSGS